jgi:hypothetical protein
MSECKLRERRQAQVKERCPELVEGVVSTSEEMTEGG